MARLNEALSTTRLAEARWPIVVQGLAMLVFVVAVPRVLDCISIELNTSIEEGKIDALRQIAGDYNDGDHRVGNRCVEVHVEGTSSGRAMQALRDGWDSDDTGAPEPDVWMPTSSMWLDLLRESREIQGLPTADEVESITRSVLVIAMPRLMAQEGFNWPDEEVSWQDVLQLSGDPAAWANRGYSEWGYFRFGKDDPNDSTSGLAATVATYYAATGKADDLGPEHLSQVPELVLGVEAGVHHYSDDIITFLERLAGHEQETYDEFSAVVLQEQLVYDYNRGLYSGADSGDEDPPATELVAMYPTDGLLQLDHPYVTLPGLSPEQEEAARDFRDHLQQDDSQEQFAAVGFRRPADGDNLVLDTDTQDGSLRREIPANQVDRPPSGATLQTILEQWDGYRKRQANILVALDTSASMDPVEPSTGRSRLATMQEAVTTGLRYLPHVHDVGLWAFPPPEGEGQQFVPEQDPAYGQLVPLSPLDEAQQDRINHEVGGLSAHDGTPLYRTVQDAYRFLARRADEPGAEDQVYAVVVLTDGGDNDPTSHAIGLEELLDEVDAGVHVSEDRAPVMIFSVAFADADLGVMQTISERTDADSDTIDVHAYDARDPTGLANVFVELLSNF